MARTGGDSLLWALALEPRMPLDYAAARTLPAREIWQAEAYLYLLWAQEGR